MEAAKKGEIIEGVIDLVERKYVFPTYAAKMGEALRTRFGAGDYNGLPSTGFARALTNDLRSVYPVPHLSVRFAEENSPAFRR